MVPLCSSLTQHCPVKVGSPSWGSGSIYLRLEDILCVLFVSLFGGIWQSDMGEILYYICFNLHVSEYQF